MIVEVRDVCKDYGTLRVLRGLSFRAEPGRPVAVTGASGSGKTTLLRIVMGLEAPDAGSVGFSGGPPKPRFGAVFQEDRLFEDFDAVTNLRLTARSARREEIRAELLKLLPEDALSKPVSSLSGGQRRRAAIVRAIVSPGDVLIMDEPFAGLDAENTERAMEYLRESSLSRPLILAVHEKDIPPWCERISVEQH